MRRFLLVLAGVLLALGVAGALSLLTAGDEPADPGTSGSRLADLEVVLDPGTGEPRRAQLACASAGDSEACGELDALDPAVLEPTAAGRTCTEQFGGPETVRITGVLRGERVDATVDRTDGCEISRYDQVRPILVASGIV